MSFAGKWVEPVIIIWTKISQNIQASMTYSHLRLKTNKQRGIAMSDGFLGMEKWSEEKEKRQERVGRKAYDQRFA